MAVKRTLRTIIAGQQVIQTHPQMTVMETVRRMAERDVGAVLVQDAGRLVGIFTERDILKRVVAGGKDPQKTLLAEVMTKNPMTANADDGVLDALTQMREARCRHLPVMDYEKLLGILSLRDVLMTVLELREEEVKALEEYLEYLPPDTSPGG